MLAQVACDGPFPCPHSFRYFDSVAVTYSFSRDRLTLLGAGSPFGDTSALDGQIPERVSSSWEGQNSLLFQKYFGANLLRVVFTPDTGK